MPRVPADEGTSQAIISRDFKMRPQIPDFLVSSERVNFAEEKFDKTANLTTVGEVVPQKTASKTFMMPFYFGR
jgi:hypothetical protein